MGRRGRPPGDRQLPAARPALKTRKDSQAFLLGCPFLAFVSRMGRARRKMAVPLLHRRKRCAHSRPARQRPPQETAHGCGSFPRNPLGDFGSLTQHPVRCPLTLTFPPLPQARGRLVPCGHAPQAVLNSVYTRLWVSRASALTFSIISMELASMSAGKVRKSRYSSEMYSSASRLVQ